MAQIEVIKTYKFFHLKFKTLEEAANYFEVTKPVMSAVFSQQRTPTKKMLEKAGINVEKRTVTKYKITKQSRL